MELWTDRVALRILEDGEHPEAIVFVVLISSWSVEQRLTFDPSPPAYEGGCGGVHEIRLNVKKRGIEMDNGENARQRGEDDKEGGGPVSKYAFGKVLSDKELPSGRKWTVTVALTLLTSSQGILIAWSKNTDSYPYNVIFANFLVESLKCVISVGVLIYTWQRDGITESNKLTTTWDEVKVYPIPALLYLMKNLMQYYIFFYVDPPTYQILKNLNIIATGILYQPLLKRRLTSLQWTAFALLVFGCITAQIDFSKEQFLQTSVEGWIMAIIMALLSGCAGVYTEVIIKKRQYRDINVQNFWLYIFGSIFNILALATQNQMRGMFSGFSFVVCCMILNQALSGLAVSMVMKYADNIVKVYSTSVAMLLTAFVSVLLFNYLLTLPFGLGCLAVSVAVYLHVKV